MGCLPGQQGHQRASVTLGSGGEKGIRRRKRDQEETKGSGGKKGSGGDKGIRRRQRDQEETKGSGGEKGIRRRQRDQEETKGHAGVGRTRGRDYVGRNGGVRGVYFQRVKEWDGEESTNHLQRSSSSVVFSSFPPPSFLPPSSLNPSSLVSQLSLFIYGDVMITLTSGDNILFDGFHDDIISSDSFVYAGREVWLGNVCLRD